MNNTIMTIKITVDFLADGGVLLNASGNDIFGVLIENKIPYEYIESGDFGEVAAFEIHIENYFQFQALGDFVFNTR
jgi:hypothetical protein